MAIVYSPGRYWGKVINHGLGKASTGTPQLMITFQIIGKVNLADPEGDLLPCEDHERSVFRSLTEKTKDWVLQDLEKLDFTGESLAQLDLERMDCCDLRGKEAALTCEHRTYQKVARENWSIAGDSGPLMQPLEEREVRQLDDLFGRSLRAAKAAKPTMKTAEAPSEAEQSAERTAKLNNEEIGAVHNEALDAGDDLAADIEATKTEEGDDDIPF